jgi:general secretion pathway protein F
MLLYNVSSFALGRFFHAGPAMSSSSAVSLDQFVALNDEIAALTRAGVPLPEGLRELGRDLPGDLGKTASVLSERLAAGQSLEQAIEQSRDQLAPVYAAVIAAGLRGGRLPAALESLSSTIRRVADIRRTALVSLVYPLALLVIATILLPLITLRLMPVVAGSYDRLRIPRPGWYEALLRGAEIADGVLPWFWLVLVAAIGWWIYRSSLARSFGSSLAGLPLLGHVLHVGRAATFAEILALLVEQRVPLDEAITLSAAASGDPALQRAGTSLAERLRRGDTSSAIPEGIPPLLGWLIATPIGPERLASSLKRLAGGYRRRVANWGLWLGLYMPIFLSAGIGGLIVLFYALSVLAPFYNLLVELS